MTFKEALDKSIEEFGVEILKEPRLINIINDYRGFDEKPAARHITRVIIKGGYMSQLLSKNNSPFVAQQMVSSLSEQYGFSKKIATEIINQINSVLDSIDKEQSESIKDVAQKSSENKLIKLEKVAEETVSFQHNDSSYINDYDITKFTDKELSNAWVDSFGVKYSQDRTRLLQANKNLVSYEIPHGVVIICDRAFCGCRSLKDIKLPKGIIKIGNRAFFGCNFEAINIEEGLTFIDDCAFGFCLNLKSVSLPQTIKNFGSNPFLSCNIKSFSCASDAFIVENDCLFDKDRSRIISYWGDKNILKLPKTLKRICNSAINYRRSLETVFLPNGLTHIEDLAFCGCSSLSSIKLPQNLNFIGNEAFYECKSMKLESLLPQNLTYIGDYAFAKCFAIKKIILPSGLTHIGSGALCQNNIWQIKSLSPEFIVYNNGLYSKDKNRILKFFGKDIHVELPSEVVLIDSSAFERCKFLQSIKLPQNLESIGYCAFSNCKSLKSIELPSSVNKIGGAAFDYCSSLEFINLPQGITEIKSFTFRYTGLGDVKLPDSLTIIGDSAFENSDLTSITFPESIKQIGEDAFRGCSSLEIIKMPEVVPSIGKRAFDWCQSIRAILIHQGTRTQYSNILPNFLRQKLTNIKKN